VAKVDTLRVCIAENRNIINYRHGLMIAFEAEFSLAL
jgi:hypothetical protein